MQVETAKNAKPREYESGALRAQIEQSDPRKVNVETQLLSVGMHSRFFAFIRGFTTWFRTSVH